MNLKRVVFFVLLAATLGFGCFIGDIGDPGLHSFRDLFAAVVVNLIATVLVASLPLIAAPVVWASPPPPTSSQGRFVPSTRV